jgi:hypothetical protein
VCKERNGAGSCVCLPQYFGDPYTGCRPECVINSDCDRSKACLNNKCYDPCPGTCGLDAECRVVNHAPSCACIVGYTGDPLSACVPIPPSKMILLSIHSDTNMSTCEDGCNFWLCSVYNSSQYTVIIQMLFNFRIYSFQMTPQLKLFNGSNIWDECAFININIMHIFVFLEYWRMAPSDSEHSLFC